MADAYVYYYTPFGGAGPKVGRSKRLGTLAAIAGRGEPIMESQTTVDSTELDPEGFLVGRSVGGPDAGIEMAGEIRSLYLRATARDREALSLDESADGQAKYLLSLESRELRKQADRIQQERRNILAAESRDRIEVEGCTELGLEPQG